LASTEGQRLLLVQARQDISVLLLREPLLILSLLPFSFFLQKDIVYSGLEETMAGAVEETKATAQEFNVDFRVAAFM